MMRKKDVDDCDTTVLNWIGETGRNFDDYNHYRQAQPTLYSLWKDFSKYDKPDPIISDSTIDKAFSFLCLEFEPYCHSCVIWSHKQAVSTWDLTSSPGYPWNLSLFTSAEFLEAFDQELPLWWEAFLRGRDLYPIWNISPKFEIRSNAKLDQYKIRSFTASPKHFTYIMQRLCADFNERFYASNSKTWSRVGMTMFNRGWDDLLRYLMFYDDGIELDGRQYDSSLFQRLLRKVCDFRKRCLATGSSWAAPYLDRIYDDIIHGRCVLPGGFIFQKRGGNPSGSANTVVDNTLCLYLLFAMVSIELFEEAGLELTYEMFSTHIRAAMYGDDNTLTMSKEFARVLTPDAILFKSRQLGLELVNEYPNPLLAKDLKFLNMSTKLYSGMYVPVPNTQKIRGSMLHNVSTPIHRYARLCGLRNVCFWNSDLMVDISELMDITSKQLRSYDPEHVDHTVGMTARGVLSCFLTDSELMHLWLGRECSSTRPYFDLFQLTFSLVFEEGLLA